MRPVTHPFACLQFYESHDDLENARVIFSKVSPSDVRQYHWMIPGFCCNTEATQVKYRGVDDLASAHHSVNMSANQRMSCQKG